MFTNIRMVFPLVFGGAIAAAFSLVGESWVFFVVILAAILGLLVVGVRRFGAPRFSHLQDEAQRAVEADLTMERAAQESMPPAQKDRPLERSP